MVVEEAVKAVSTAWTCSPPTFVTEKDPVTFCGIEIRRHKESQGFELTQQAYEQELLERWPQEKSSPQVQLRVPAPDAEDESDATAEEIKEAQALTGALLWLSTRCRPELVFPVHVMAKHAVKKPKLTIANGHSIIRYLQAKSGGLVYAKASWNGDWGPRQQLLAKRHDHLLEVYSDVSFAAATGWKSTTGVSIYVAGAIVAWMTSSQPFVTQSTAEAELVALTEANLCGQSIQSLLEVMLELDPQESPLEVIMAGVRQHLEARGWVLRHLRGTELVADGMTKQLQGQSWDRFLEDLGGERSNREDGTQRSQQVHQAKMAVAYGGLLMGQGVQQGNDNLRTLGATMMEIGTRLLQQWDAWPDPEQTWRSMEDLSISGEELRQRGTEDEITEDDYRGRDW